MVSRKGLTMQFIRRYLRENGFSPSYGEIARALGTDDATAARRIVARLVADGLLEREPGARRGIRLAVQPETPEMSRARAIELLRADGFIVNVGSLSLAYPLPDTNEALPLLDVLEQIPGGDSESGNEHGPEASGGSEGDALDHQSPSPAGARGA
ncbi:MarR family transcriptional regulator [Sphingomonas sp. ABOLF]|uniref:LexA family protein n=1 Tax=Sphingomonas sp. ABOLF TaxID=1985879 RepID=UPI0013E0648E|nr:MarR family transcriptional regulator [Sphingomonas sp. ABOLF]